MLILTGCGGNAWDSSDLPPLPPTMTSEPEPAVEPEPTIEPTPTPEGQVLEPLEDGQEITAEDRRYTIQVPRFWVQNTAPPADLAFRESGGTPADDGFTYKVFRESLPQSVEDVEDYTALQEERLRERDPDVEMLSVEPVQIAGTQGMRAVYTTTRGSQDVLLHQVYVIDGKTGFVLTGSAPLDGDIEAAQELFDDIAGSFAFPRG